MTQIQGNLSHSAYLYVGRVGHQENRQKNKLLILLDMLLNFTPRFFLFLSLTSRVANNQQRPCRNSQELAATVVRLVEKANMLYYGDFGGLLSAERGEDEREKREHLDLGRMPAVQW